MAPNTNKRILPDLSQASKEELIAALEAQGVTIGKVPGVEIIQNHDQPFLQFTGNFRPFSFSVPKCKKIMANIDAIAAFAKSDGKKIS